MCIIPPLSNQLEIHKAKPTKLIFASRAYVFLVKPHTHTTSQSEQTYKSYSHILTFSIPIYPRLTPETRLRSFLNDLHRSSLLRFPLPVVHGIDVELCTCFTIMPFQVVKYAGFVTADDALKDLGLGCVATFVNLPGEASASYAPPEIRHRFYS